MNKMRSPSIVIWYMQSSCTMRMIDMLLPETRGLWVALHDLLDWNNTAQGNWCPFLVFFFTSYRKPYPGADKCPVLALVLH